MAGGDDQRGRSGDLTATVDGPADPAAPTRRSATGEARRGETGTSAGRGVTDPPATLDETRAPAGRSFTDSPAALGETLAPAGRSFTGGGPTDAPRTGLSATLAALEERERRARPREDLEVTRDSVGRSGPQRHGDPTLPQRLGRYMVIKQLGAGGMGVVYKAYDPDLDRKVALKLLLGQATSQARARLLREAQAMAKLSHPNVVPVFDVGVVDEQVFVAMDFVDGQTLNAWMEQRRPWQEVVDLFVQAGRGLAAAHTVGLIHRDFKPDNVLLSRDPSTGELRAQVADFGLARRDDEAADAPREESDLVLASRRSLLDAGLTRVGAVIGTPAYMSPEQHVGATVDARTDQFSFCIALFEALYGERPFTGDTLEALAIAAGAPRRRPPPPGSAVPKWLHRICLRGLQPDRDARFADMDALLAEIARRRVQGRNRRVIAGGGLALCGALTAVLLTRGEPGEQRCGGGPARIAEVWGAKAQRDAERAFTATGVVYAADAWAAARAQVERYSAAWLTMYHDSCEATARGEQSAALMDLRMVCLGGALQHLGALTRQYAAGDKQVVKRAVDMALALPPLDACADVATLREVADAPPPAQAEAVAAVRAEVAEARTLEAAAKFKDAVALATVALALATELGYGPAITEANLVLGDARLGAGEHEAAIAPVTAAIAGAIASRNDARVFEGLVMMLDAVGFRLGRYKEAEVWSALAGGALLRNGDRPRDQARLLAIRGLTEVTASHLPEAEALLLRALAVREAEYGPDSPRLGSIVNSLGAIYVRSGRYSEAEATFTRALALAEAAGGPRHPDVALPLNNLALSYERLGRIDEALAALRRARDIIAGNSGADHPNVGILQQNIGGMLRLLGKLPEARAELDAAKTLLTAKLGPDHPALGGALTMSGDVALSQGDLARARAEYQAADALRTRALGAEHADRAYALVGLGKVALAEGRPDAARAPLEQALALWEDATPDPGDIGELRFQLARALWDTDEQERARALVLQARADLTTAGINARAQLRELEAWSAAHP